MISKLPGHNRNELYAYECSASDGSVLECDRGDTICCDWFLTQLIEMGGAADFDKSDVQVRDVLENNRRKHYTKPNVI